MKLILHIGTEKTGTTSIQRYLHDNRKIFEEYGFYTLKTLELVEARKLAAYCQDINKFDDFYIDKNITTIDQKKRFFKIFIEDLENEMKSIPRNIHTIIVSSEHLHSRLTTQNEVDRVKNIFSDYIDEFQVLVYLRRQIELATSLYTTALKSRNIVPDIDTFVTKQCFENNPYYNYDLLLSKWENTFGNNALTVRLFDKKVLHKNDLISDFSHIVFGSSIINIENIVNLPNIENESLHPFGQDCLNVLNKNYRDKLINEATFRKIFKIINYEWKGKGYIPSYKTVVKCMLNYHSSNEKIQQKYLPDRLELFSQNYDVYKRENNTISTNELKIYQYFLGILNVSYSENDIDDIRDIALYLEKTDIKKSFILMNIAYKLRPGGVLIKKKLEQYSERIKNDKKIGIDN